MRCDGTRDKKTSRTQLKSRLKYLPNGEALLSPGCRLCVKVMPPICWNRGPDKR